MPNIGESYGKGVGIAVRLDGDIGSSCKHNRIAQIQCFDIRRRASGIDCRSRFHIADQALFRIEPRRGMRIDQILYKSGSSVWRRPFRRHRLHAFFIERYYFFAVSAHHRLPLQKHLFRNDTAPIQPVA